MFQTEALEPQDLIYIVVMSSTILMLDSLRKTCCASCFIDAPNYGNSRLVKMQRGNLKKQEEDAHYLSDGSFDDSDAGSILLKNKNNRVRSRNRHTRPVMH